MTQALLNIGDFVGFIEQPKAVPVREAQCHYMLRMHPNYDLKAERQYTARGVKVYVPKEKRSVRVTWGRTVVREIPIFSGVLFVPDYEADLARLKNIADGVGGFIKYNGEALKVTPFWMTQIRAFEERRQIESLERNFKIGQEVRIIGGLYDMWEGKIARLDSNNRLRVLIQAMAGEVPVDIDEDQVEAVSEPTAAPRKTEPGNRNRSRQSRQRLPR
jgi:transcription antitermination factor NusG